jgi:hypothetical protein
MTAILSYFDGDSDGKLGAVARILGSRHSTLYDVEYLRPEKNHGKIMEGNGYEESLSKPD